jgi:hypothetical protein
VTENDPFERAVSVVWTGVTTQPWFLTGVALLDRLESAGICHTHELTWFLPPGAVPLADHLVDGSHLYGIPVSLASCDVFPHLGMVLV